MTCKDVAKQLHLSPPIVKAMIQKGVPFGCVVRNEGSSKDRIIIYPDKFKGWYKANYANH